MLAYFRVVKEMFHCGEDALEHDCGISATNLFVRITGDFLPDSVIKACLELNNDRLTNCKGRTVDTIAPGVISVSLLICFISIVYL